MPLRSRRFNLGIIPADLYMMFNVLQQMAITSNSQIEFNRTHFQVYWIKSSVYSTGHK